MTNLKICVNCKWCRDGGYCDSPKNVDGIDLVTGKNKVIFYICETHRSSDKFGCTKKGLFYEDK